LKRRGKKFANNFTKKFNYCKRTTGGCTEEGKTARSLGSTKNASRRILYKAKNS
jgi:hypothetical protein